MSRLTPGPEDAKKQDHGAGDLAAATRTRRLSPRAISAALSHRQQVVRAYGPDGSIADGILATDGEHALAVIRQLLARPDVTLVHLRNVGYGCYNFAVRPA